MQNYFVFSSVVSSHWYFFLLQKITIRWKDTRNISKFCFDNTAIGRKKKDVLRSDPSVGRPILSDRFVKRLILSKPDCVETRSDVWLRHLAKRRLTTDDERRFRTTKTCETRISSLIRRTDRILTILRKVSGRQSVRVVRNCWWESSNSPMSLSSMPTLVCSTTKWGLMSFGLRRRRLRRTGPIWGTARGTVPAPQAGEQTRLPVSEI